MNNKKGFTLLEILIVVVIAASVLLFAVPAYKRTQDKSVFTAAQGVLIELRSAVQSVRQDLAAGGSSVQLPSGTTPLQLLAAWQNESSVDYSAAAEKDINTLSAARLPYALFAKKYMQPVPFESGTNKYKRYEYYICPTSASNAKCCGNNSEVVACMWDTARCSRPSKGLYHGARILADGTIVPFQDNNCRVQPGSGSGTGVQGKES